VICPIHGKRIATEADLAAYARRDSCVRAGDCACAACRKVCWLRECEEAAALDARETAQQKGVS